MDSKKEKISIKKVINYAGAFIALLIGSGFATGQEILQYFTAYGYTGIFAVLLCFILLAYVGISFISVGFKKKFKNPNDIYKYYCGNVIGTFYDYFSVFFIFLSFSVMIGGADATVIQHYKLPQYTGGIVMAILAIITVLMGLKKLVEIIGNIGPVIVVLALFVGAFGIIINIDNAGEAPMIVEDLIASGDIKVASSNWLFATGSYVGFCMLWLAAFLGQIGKNGNSLKEVKGGAFFGALGFSLGVLVMALGILISIKDLGASQIPTLVLAGKIHPLLANIFSVIILLGIYTTSVPLLWAVVARFAEEKTTKFRVITVLCGVLGVVLGLVLRFDVLVNYVYVLNGYVGLVLLFIMLGRTVFKKEKKVASKLV